LFFGARETKTAEVSIFWGGGGLGGGAMRRVLGRAVLYERVSLRGRNVIFAGNINGEKQMKEKEREIQGIQKRN